MIGYTTPKARKYSTISLGRTTLGSSAPSSEKTIEMGNSRKGSADLNSLVNNYKTEVINLRCQVCKYWEDSQACPFAETVFLSIYKSASLLMVEAKSELKMAHPWNIKQSFAKISTNGTSVPMGKDVNSFTIVLIAINLKSNRHNCFSGLVRNWWDLCLQKST